LSTTNLSGWARKKALYLRADVRMCVYGQAQAQTRQTSERMSGHCV
jgi:hypothetical protein